jgi:hypothetical protein
MGAVTESVFRRITRSADGDLLDEAEVIGGPHVCAAARVVCKNADRFDP